MFSSLVVIFVIDMDFFLEFNPESGYSSSDFLSAAIGTAL